jgi:hypothetical protein
MTKAAFAAFRQAAGRYRAVVDGLNAALPELPALIQRLVDQRDGPSYTVDTPVLYNLALDEYTPDSEVKLILAADNPGRREQAAENRRYLVGPSGKIAERFFRDHPELGIDFRRHVLILNKTPIHTPRTAELKALCRLGGPRIAGAVVSSQRTMAELLLEFWQILAGSSPGGFPGVPVWIIGYSEMKKGGLFEAYTGRLKELCAANPAFRDSLFLYRHFSMNQFTIDLKRRSPPPLTDGEPEEGLEQRLRRVGAAYRERVLG